MKGVILAAGTGTRLHHLTKVTNKHLLLEGKEPIIFNHIRQLLSAGITNILVVTGKDYMGEWTNAGTFESLIQANQMLFPINNTIHIRR